MRREGNLRLARELAFGLKGFAPDDVKKELGSLYGMLVVANSLDTTGVAIDARDWVAEIRAHL